MACRLSLGSWSVASARIKRAMLAAYVAAMLLAARYYFRHEEMCEPYAYSKFALSEYVLVVANIAFHTTLVLDLPDSSLRLYHPQQPKSD
jgi:hypothetical protein